MRLNQRAENIVLPIGAVVLALLIGAVLIRLNGSNPWTAYSALIDGALGSKAAVARTLSRATPLVFTGLAVIVGLKAGLFNIGAQGQLLLGATFAAWVGYEFTGLPAVLHVPFALIVGGIFGMLPAALAGYLKAYRGAHEVITTIMLNAILVNMTEYLVGARGPFHDPDAGAQSRTPLIQPSAEIPDVWGLPLGFFLAVVAAVVIWFVIARTTIGFRITTVGQSRHAAEYAGISWTHITVLAMALSGFLAGLGGAIETQGRVRPLRGRVQRRARFRWHHGRPARPRPTAAGHPRRPPARHPARRADADGVRGRCAAGDHRRDPGHHPPARLRPDRRALDPAGPGAEGCCRTDPDQLGMGRFVSERSRCITAQRPDRESEQAVT